MNAKLSGSEDRMAGDRLDLDAIEARLKAATPGPWVVREKPWPISALGDERFPDGLTLSAQRQVTTAWEHGQVKSPLSIWYLCSSPYGEPDEILTIDEHDADFIAHAPEDIAALLKALRARVVPHSCQEWREAIVGCAVCHEDYYAQRERPSSDAWQPFKATAKHGEGRMHSEERCQPGEPCHACNPSEAIKVAQAFAKDTHGWTVWTCEELISVLRVYDREARAVPDPREAAPLEPTKTWQVPVYDGPPHYLSRRSGNCYCGAAHIWADTAGITGYVKVEL